MFPRKHIHATHAHHTTHTHTLKSQYIHIHHARYTTHTQHVHTPHPIMLLYMVEFIQALIVTEKVTWPNLL